MRPHNIKTLLSNKGHHYLSVKVAYRMWKDFYQYTDWRLKSVTYKEQEQKQSKYQEKKNSIKLWGMELSRKKKQIG